ncbi:pyridoxal-dependent decarboxylase domain-containing protein 1 [Oryzias latipes]|uniref:Pyridoxal-dependent decarboxylase domain-containing protein 1 n=1 Tax=Oryzias latipes TaxID=8090 RepID=H2MXJ3_ORYLA|nr:pyridoxal-dependent decarboxylase domain-containing protein 1 [Oryzias latipes]
MSSDGALAEVEKSLSDAMKTLRDGQREPGGAADRCPLWRNGIPGPLQGDGLDVSSLLQVVQHLLHEEEEEEEEEEEPRPARRLGVGVQDQVTLLGHSLAAYFSVLQRERLRKLSTRVLSDSTLWLCRLFRYENGSAYFHEDDRDGIVKVCRLVLHAQYKEYGAEGYGALSAHQPVIYQSAAGRPELGQHLCSQLGLPLSSLCTVPCNTVFGSQHQMDVALLEKLLKEDTDAGKRPLLLIANAGTYSAGHTDKLSRLKDVCDQSGLWLHVEGVNLATLALEEVASTVTAASRSDSLTLTPGPWLGLPAVPAVTLYRHEDPAMALAAGLTSSRLVEKLRALPLWLSLQHLGHNGITQKIRHAAALSQQLLQRLKSLDSIKTLVEDELDSPVVLFKFCLETSSGEECRQDSVDLHQKNLLDSFNRWLGQQAARRVPGSGVDVVELDGEGVCIRFSPLLTAAELGTQGEDVERLVATLQELVPAMTSTVTYRAAFWEETRRLASSLTYVEEMNWAGLGVVRYEPQSDEADGSRRQQQLEKINKELLKKLQELDSDIVFSSAPEFVAEKNGVFVGMVTEDVAVAELVQTIAALGREVEESGRLLENMTEVVKKGILEAELELQRASEEKLLEEGMLRQIPVVGSVLNWLSPVQSSVKGRTFDLAAGSLDSTETMYSTKAQGGGASLQDPPSLLPQRLPGQRLFRRSGADSPMKTGGRTHDQESSGHSASGEAPHTPDHTHPMSIPDSSEEGGAGEELEERQSGGVQVEQGDR